MLKSYRVTVNGTAYDVTVEETSKGMSPAPVPAASPVKTAPPPPPASPSANPDGQAVTLPMPGVILDVLVSVGQKVEKNQVVAILEAMKMENEIVTPYAGKILAVKAAKGDSVDSGDTLVIVGG